MFLNLGHTFAHALESYLKGKVLHGEAVAAGIYASAQLSEKAGLCSSGFPVKLKEDFLSVGLKPCFNILKARYPSSDYLVQWHQEYRDLPRCRSLIPQYHTNQQIHTTWPTRSGPSNFHSVLPHRPAPAAPKPRIKLSFSYCQVFAFSVKFHCAKIRKKTIYRFVKSIFRPLL